MNVPTQEYLKSINFTDTLKTDKGIYFIEANLKGLNRLYLKQKDNTIIMIKDLKWKI
jgi:hypothetical protein